MDRIRPGRSLLVALLLTGIAAAGCDTRAGADATSISSSTLAIEVPSVTDRTPLALATTPAVSPPPSDAMPLPDAPSPDVPPHPVGPVTMPAIAPVRLQIPSIGVDSTLIGLGLQADGSLEVPPSGFPAGWYTGSPAPGALGPAIIAGHVDWAGQPGVFFDLRDLASGAEIAITREDGTVARFRVTRIERFAKERFPTGAVYGDLDHAGLRLITCDGAFDRKARSYRDNLVVFAELTS